MPPDPRRLLRRPQDPEPYPTEPADDEVAAAAGLAPDAILRFDMNTLGGGPLPAVRAAHAAFDPSRSVEYGDQQYRALRARLGERVGVDPRRVVIGAGADELIRLVTHLFVGEADAVVIPTPTFGMFAVEAGLVGADVVRVARSHPGSRQSVTQLTDAARSVRARLVWVCSPNNPTGDAYSLDEVAAVAGVVDGVVAVDEAYLEFAAASRGLELAALSAIGLEADHPNVVVIRSMAKAYGLAGARIGYLVVPDWLADRVDAERLPLAVGSHTEALALAALDDEAAARDRQRTAVNERARVADALAALGWEVLPSVTNFVLGRPPEPAGEVAAELLRHGMVVREYPPASPLAAWLRIGARAPRENDRLLGALGERSRAMNRG